MIQILLNGARTHAGARLADEAVVHCGLAGSLCGRQGAAAMKRASPELVRVHVFVWRSLVHPRLRKGLYSALRGRLRCCLLSVHQVLLGRRL